MLVLPVNRHKKFIEQFRLCEEFVKHLIRLVTPLKKANKPFKTRL